MNGQVETCMEWNTDNDDKNGKHWKMKFTSAAMNSNKRKSEIHVNMVFHILPTKKKKKTNWNIIKTTNRVDELEVLLPALDDPREVEQFQKKHFDHRD